jgi:hypothetical protein
MNRHSDAYNRIKNKSENIEKMATGVLVVVMISFVAMIFGGGYILIRVLSNLGLW